MKDTTEIENRLIGHIINFDEGKSLISELSDDLFTDETNRSLFAIIRKEFKSGNPDTGICFLNAQMNRNSVFLNVPTVRSERTM